MHQCRRDKLSAILEEKKVNREANIKSTVWGKFQVKQENGTIVRRHL